MAGTTYHGSVVAFEGNIETISTQLRLLPKSHQILVLPSVDSYLPKERRKHPFDPRKHIKQIHNATQRRLADARTFLEDSTPENKKLVFLNGGTVRAQAMCLTAISENQTAGSLTKADRLFAELVKDGVASLSENYEDRRSRIFGLDSNDHSTGTDPIIRAMKAAEMLDCETASLQTSNELDLTNSSSSMRRRRSLSLPIYRYSEHMEGATPFYVFGAHEQESDAMSNRTSKHTIRDDASTLHAPRSPLPVVDEASTHEGTFLFPPKSPSCVGDPYRRQSVVSNTTSDLLSPLSDGFASQPQTPDRVVFGEACVVQMTSPNLRRVTQNRRSSSLDRSTISTMFMRGQSYAGTLIDGRRPSKMSQDTDFSSVIASSSYYGDSNASIRSRSSRIDSIRTVFVRGRQPSQNQPQQKNKRKALVQPRFSHFRSSYVDVSTAVEEEDLEEDDEDMTFRPILPVSEDLIVYFTESESDRVLDHVLHSFKDGSYPVEGSSPTSEVDEPVPATPTSTHTVRHDPPRFACDWESRPSVEITGPSTVQQQYPQEEYDPYASHGDFQYNPKAVLKKQEDVGPIVTNLRVEISQPPTPDNTPPPSITLGFDKKLHEFCTATCHTAVSMQNALRSTLSQYFPVVEDAGHNQFHFPLLPDSDGLWQPIFRETDGLTSRNGTSRIDQVIAIGSQRGVKSQFVSAITGQLQMLGSKQSGLNCSGRLDLRYLIASAMQVFTAQPLANQTMENPFSNPFLLATLIVPHLETYLAMNPNIRFLMLEYPPEHLATALALQKLVGVDLFKVAGIINTDPNARRTTTPTRDTPSPSSVSEGLAAISLPTSPGSISTSTNFNAPGSAKTFSGSIHLSFSKANFLLASSAPEKEIASFINTFWKILTEASSLYVLEELPETAKTFLRAQHTLKEVPSTLLCTPGSPVSQFPPSSRTAVSQFEQARNLKTKMLSPPMTPIEAAKARPVTPLSPGYTPSARSGKTQRERIKKLLGTSPSGTAWSVYSGAGPSRGSAAASSPRSVRSRKKRTKSLAESSFIDDDAASSFMDFGDGFGEEEEEGKDIVDEERRLMPLFERRTQQRPGSVNSAKALKWLGIS